MINYFYTGPVETQKQLLVGYWGQNSAGSKLTDPAKYEKSLGYFCREYKYDIIVIGFVVPLFHQRHKGKVKLLYLLLNLTRFRISVSRELILM